MTDFIAEYLNYAAETEAPAKFDKWVAISLISASLQRRCYLSFHGSNYYPNLYTFLVAPSGMARKSTAAKIGLDLLSHLPHIKTSQSTMTVAVLQKTLAALTKDQKFVLHGKEQAQSAMLLYSSEAKELLGGQRAEGMLETLTNLYDTSQFDHKPYTAETVTRGMRMVERPYLSLLACSTQEWLLDIIPVSQFESGFASRCIFIWHDEPTPTDDLQPFLKLPTGEIKQSMLDNLARIGNMAGHYSVSPEAEIMFVGWYKQTEAERQTKETPKHMSGYYARRPSTLVKLAMIAAASEGNELIITPERFARALTWLADAEKDMFELFSPIARNTNFRILQTVFNTIRDNPGIMKRELSRLMLRELGTRQFREVMDQLSEAGVVRYELLGRDIRLYPLRDSL